VLCVTRSQSPTCPSHLLFAPPLLASCSPLCERISTRPARRSGCLRARCRPWPSASVCVDIALHIARCVQAPVRNRCTCCCSFPLQNRLCAHRRPKSYSLCLSLPTTSGVSRNSRSGRHLKTWRNNISHHFSRTEAGGLVPHADRNTRPLNSRIVEQDVHCTACIMNAVGLARVLFEREEGAPPCRMPAPSCTSQASPFAP